MISRKDPFPIYPHLSNVARRVWFAHFTTRPLLSLETDLEISPLLAEAKKRNEPVLPFLLKAGGKALIEFPELNYYNFDGKMVWAGEHVRVSGTLELEDGSVPVHTFADVERKATAAINNEIAEALAYWGEFAKQPAPLLWKLRNTFPRSAFMLEWVLGTYQRSYARHVAPLLVTAINQPGIYQSIAQPTYSPMLIVSRAREGRASMTLCLDHGYGNARQLGRFLTAIRDILVAPELL